MVQAHVREGQSPRILLKVEHCLPCLSPMTYNCYCHHSHMRLTGVGLRLPESYHPMCGAQLSWSCGHSCWHEWRRLPGIMPAACGGAIWAPTCRVSAFAFFSTSGRFYRAQGLFSGGKFRFELQLPLGRVEDSLGTGFLKWKIGTSRAQGVRGVRCCCSCHGALLTLCPDWACGLFSSHTPQISLELSTP